MILGFKKVFADPLRKKIKIHTFREDRKNRWRAGRLIHAYIGARQSWMELIFEDTCKSVQHILMVMNGDRLHVIVDRKRVRDNKIIYLMAINDGFINIQEMIDWFFPVGKNGIRKRTMWGGKIIHWTDLKY